MNASAVWIFFQNNKDLGRVMLRFQGKTVAAGIVLECLPDRKKGAAK
jgi:translation elongation factor EF-1alpha